MTRSEVIKALRNCADCSSCKGCAFYDLNDGQAHCVITLLSLAADMLSETPLRCAECTRYGDYKCEMPYRDVGVKPDDYCSMGAWYSAKD